MSDETRTPPADHLLRGVARDANVRAVACLTTDLVQQACDRHGTLPTASVALGRALTAAALMVAQLKGEQRVALKFEGNGPLRKIITEAHADGAVRGYVAEPQVDLPSQDGNIRIAPALGRAGLLTVRKDLGLKEPYSGTVHLYNSEIASDLAFYLTESEQVPSAVGLGVFLDAEGRVAAAGGYLLQSLPPAQPRVIEQLATQAEQAPPVSEFLHGGGTPAQLLHTIFGAIPFTELNTRPLRHQCSCSPERVEQALVSLGATTVEEMVHSGETAEVACEFCRLSYRVPPQRLHRLLHEAH